LRRPLEPGQYLSIRYTERLAEPGIEPSAGSVGASYNNALAESVIGLFKTEVIRSLGPWRNMEDMEFATLRWVWSFNHHPLPEPIGHVPPGEYEEMYYRSQEGETEEAGLKLHSLRKDRGVSYIETYTVLTPELRPVRTRQSVLDSSTSRESGWERKRRPP
jgi:hypothetical protein